MAIQHVCDGCGSVVDGRPTRVGLVLHGDYCLSCAPVAVALRERIDELHEEVAVLWRTGLHDLLGEFRSDHPKFSVPDLAELEVED